MCPVDSNKSLLWHRHLSVCVHACMWGVIPGSSIVVDEFLKPQSLGLNFGTCTLTRVARTACAEHRGVVMQLVLGAQQSPSQPSVVTPRAPGRQESQREPDIVCVFSEWVACSPQL